ncbi:MAG: cytochrome B [Bacteroidetes bacterium]|nr:cytochrome B [Bacteroidota bacterium]
MFKSANPILFMANATFAENLNMYSGLTHLHSANRYLILVFILFTIVDALLSGGNSSYSKKSKIMALIALILIHVQAALGLVQYFLSPWFKRLMDSASDVMSNPQARFFAVEHWLIMVVGVVLITVGYSKAKRIEKVAKRYRTILIYYGIGLVIFLIGIPWPFLKTFGTWI